MTFTHLFTPLKLGALTIPNRLLMAPLTRCRADENHVPTALMAEHYSQRASAGLIIAEATAAMDGCSAFGAEPGIYNDAQVAGWKLVTDAVHAKGGQIVLQIWHGGRACHPALNGGKAGASTLTQPLPLGPFIAVGATIALFWGEELMTGYQQFMLSPDRYILAVPLLLFLSVLLIWTRKMRLRSL